MGANISFVVVVRYFFGCSEMVSKPKTKPTRQASRQVRRPPCGLHIALRVSPSTAPPESVALDGGSTRVRLLSESSRNAGIARPNLPWPACHPSIDALMTAIVFVLMIGFEQHKDSHRRRRRGSCTPAARSGCGCPDPKGSNQRTTAQFTEKIIIRKVSGGRVMLSRCVGFSPKHVERCTAFCKAVVQC